MANTSRCNTGFVFTAEHRDETTHSYPFMQPNSSRTTQYIFYIRGTHCRAVCARTDTLVLTQILVPFSLLQARLLSAQFKALPEKEKKRWEKKAE